MFLLLTPNLIWTVVFCQLSWLRIAYGATPQLSLSPKHLPQVDLGYAIYQASSYNVCIVHLFSCIEFEKNHLASQ